MLAGRKLDLSRSQDSHRRFSIAIDGPAGAGKSTVAQKVAAKLSYLYIDTGAMYRAATWIALDKKANLDNESEVLSYINDSTITLQQGDQSTNGRVKVFVNDSDVTMIVRSRIITRFVSQIAAMASVRKVLVRMQQEMAETGSVVMDGRDIGTVVLPDADVKIYLTASPSVRAERRLKELKEMGQAADFETLLAEIEQRDHFDMTRQTSPLRQADDAVLIDTDTLSIDQVASEILNLAGSKVST